MQTPNFSDFFGDEEVDKDTVDTDPSDANSDDDFEGEDLSLEGNRTLLKVVKKQGVNTFRATTHDRVHVHMTAILRKSNKTIYSTREPEERLYTMKLGDEANIKGLDIGLRTMHAGEIARFTCKKKYKGTIDEGPPDLHIPRNRTVIFEVELVNWDFGTDITYQKDGTMYKSVQKKGDDSFDPPEPGSFIDMHLIGYYGGRRFIDKSFKYEFPGAEKQMLPKGIDWALRTFYPGERSLVYIVKEWGYKDGWQEHDIPPDGSLLFDITLNGYKPPKNPDDAAMEDRINIAEKCHTEATELFKKGQYRNAVLKYEGIIDQLATIFGGHPDVGTGGLNADQFESPFQAMERTLKEQGLGWERYAKQRDDLFCNALTNIALCYLRLREPALAAKHCNKCLEEKPSHIKALYRRAQARMMENRYQEAAADLDKLLVLRPRNKPGRDLLEQCRQQNQQYKQKKKKQYGNFLEKYQREDQLQEADKVKTKRDRKQADQFAILDGAQTSRRNDSD